MNIQNSNIPAFLLCKKTLRHIELILPVFTIGREKSCVHYCIENQSDVSRIHARILKKHNRYYIEDCHSQNYTYLNGCSIRPSQEYLLSYGDHIRFADEEYVFIDPSCAMITPESTIPDELYTFLYSNLQAMQSPIHCQSASAEEINNAMHKILSDHPDLCHFEGEWYWNNGIIPHYTLTETHTQQLNKFKITILKQLKLQPTATVFEKASAVYHWLADSVTYDRSAPHGQTAYGALAEGRAVCKGIAKAYQLLLIQLGIPCQLVEGSLDNEIKHVWVRFCADGIWYHSDVTMAYPFFHFIGAGITKDFVAVSEEQICRTHIIWNGDHAPKQECIFFQSLQKQHIKMIPCQLHIPASIKNYLHGEAEYITSGSVSQIYRFDTAVLKRIPCGEDPAKLYYAMRESALLRRLSNCFQTVKLNAWDVTREQDGYAVYFVLQYHQPLDKYCSRFALTPELAIILIESACNALLECYQAGVAHLDIHPGNLLVSDSNMIILTDFSSSVAVDELPQISDMRGTPAYMAPEVYYSKEYSQTADVYSLGIILYCLLNEGKLPFGDKVSVREAVKMRMEGKKVTQSDNVPKELRLCVEKACSFEPAQRYPDLKSFIEALHEARRTITSDSGFAIPGIVKQSIPSPIPAHPVSGHNRPMPPAFIPNSQPAHIPDISPAQTDGFYADSLGETVLLTTPPVQPPVIPPANLIKPEPNQSHSTISALPKPRHKRLRDLFYKTTDDFHADSVGVSTVLSIPPITQSTPAEVNLSQVQFSAISQKSVLKGEYTLVHLYMYEQDFRSVVDEALSLADFPMQEKKSGLYKVQENTRVKVILSSRDIQIEDNVTEEVWSGGYLCFDFALEIPADCSKKQILLNATIYFNDVPATRLLMTLQLQDQNEQKLDLQRKDILSAFVSYASQDRQRVASVIQGMQKARPDMDIFFDINKLRSGDDWEKTLYQKLAVSDILFLCWSRHAKASSWVEKEWRYVLETKGIDSIEPIPIELPEVCPPPPELQSKHFNDNLLYIININNIW